MWLDDTSSGLITLLFLSTAPGSGWLMNLSSWWKFSLDANFSLKIFCIFLIMVADRGQPALLYTSEDWCLALNWSFSFSISKLSYGHLCMISHYAFFRKGLWAYAARRCYVQSVDHYRKINPGRVTWYHPEGVYFTIMTNWLYIIPLIT